MKSATKLIIVSGMHRSGTSFLSQVISRLGVFFPGPLIGASDSNPNGHLENALITSIHDQLLVDLGRTWSGRNGHQPLPDGWRAHTATTSAYRQVKTALNDYLSEGRPCIAIKDPRISLLLPFWQDICQDLDIEKTFLFALRHPQEVVQSLVRRDQFTVGMNAWRGQLLWQRYNAAIIETLGDIQPLFFDHVTWQKSPEMQLRRLCSHLGLNADCREPDIKHWVGFVQPERPKSGSVSDRPIHPDVVTLYRHIIEFSQDRLPLSKLQTFLTQKPLPEFPVHYASKLTHRLDRLRLLSSNVISPSLSSSPRQLTQRWTLVSDHVKKWPQGISVLPFFLPEWIYEQLPRLRFYERDLVAWYLYFGSKSGITPHPFVSRWYYARQCKGQHVSEFISHYLTKGWRQGLSLHPLFDTQFYLKQCETRGIAVDGPPMRHFLRHGIQEDIPSSPYFNPIEYRLRNPDVAGSLFYPITHYLMYGWKDGRSPDSSFNPKLFLKTADYDADLDPFSYSLQEND